MKKFVDNVFSGFWALCFLFYLTIKIAGTSLAAWSWWWLILPQVPILSLLVRHWNL